MKLSINNNKNSENKNVQNNAQVNNVEMHEVDVIGLMGALKANGKAKLSDHFKDAEVVEPIEEIKAEEPKAEPKKEVKLKRKVSLKAKTDAPKPEPKAETKAAPKAAPAYSIQEYTTKKGKTAYLLFGFDSKEAAEKIAEKCVHTVTASWRTGEDGEKRYCLSMGSRYGDFARVLCAGLNQGDKKIINGACAGSYNVYEQAVADGKAAREEKKAEQKAAKEAEKKAEAKAAATIAKAAKKAAPKAKAEPKSYSEADVAAMLCDIAEGKAIPAHIRKLMKVA